MASRRFVNTFPDSEWLLSHGAEHLPESLLDMAARMAPKTVESRWIYRESSLSRREKRRVQGGGRRWLGVAAVSLVVLVAATTTTLLGVAPIILGVGVSLAGLVIASVAIRYGLYQRRLSKDPEAVLGQERCVLIPALLNRHQVLVRALVAAYRRGIKSHVEMTDALVLDLWEGIDLVRERDALVRAAPSPQILEGHPVLAEIDRRLVDLIQQISSPATFEREVSQEEVSAFRQLAEDASSRIRARTEMSRLLKE